MTDYERGRREALEEAAKVCEAFASHDPDHVASVLRARALAEQDAPQPEAQAQPSTVPEGTPERIWLNVGDVIDRGDPDAAFPADHEGVTWCDGKVDEGDVEYVRVDLVAAPAQPQPQPPKREQIEPDMFWNADDPERGGDLQEVAEQIADDMTFGETVTVKVLCALRLPDRDLRVSRAPTGESDEWMNFELVESGITQQGGDDGN